MGEAELIPAVKLSNNARSSIPVHFARAGFFQTRSSSGVLQLIVFELPTSVPKWPWFGCFGESGARETKNGPKWALEPVLMVRTICQEWPQSAGFRPLIRAEKKCPDWADWRRERDSDSRYNRCLRGAVACPTAPPILNPGSASRCMHRSGSEAAFCTKAGGYPRVVG
jgi:hypothetical protein